MTPSELRALERLWWAAWSRKLRRSERRWLDELERRCGATLGERQWGLSLKRMPRRLRTATRIGRIREVMLARSELVGALVRRVRQLAPPVEPEPIHGRVCPPGCAECAAIQRWRTIYEVISGADAVTRRYLFP